MIVIGTHQAPQGLNCAYCGYATCAEKPQDTPCAINSIDVGIAIGSACAKAADLRVDSRVMFSAGWAVERLGLLKIAANVSPYPSARHRKTPSSTVNPKKTSETDRLYTSGRMVSAIGHTTYMAPCRDRLV